MPQLVRHYCSRCGESVYNCIINGKRTPILLYLVASQPSDTGDALDLNGPGVAVTSLHRALTTLPVPRVELCVRCVAEVFNLPLVEAQDDPITDIASNVGLAAQRLAGLSETEKAQQLTAHVYTAVANGQHVQLDKALAAAGVTDPTQLQAGHAGLAVTVPDSSLPIAPPVGVGISQGTPS